jgi:hypothetical protein
MSIKSSNLLISVVVMSSSIIGKAAALAPLVGR